MVGTDIQAVGQPQVTINNCWAFQDWKYIDTVEHWDSHFREFVLF